MEIDVEKTFSKDNRPSWDDYFLELADAASKRATCNRGKSGCVIVRDKQVLATDMLVLLPDYLIVMMSDTC